MSTATAEPEVTTPEAPTPVDVQAIRLYEYSTWVHVGPGAENCEAINEETGANSCSDPLHFHAWCRLPNQFSHREIREIALAAKARKARQLRNEGTDAYEILESELDELLATGKEGKAVLVDELLDMDWWKDYSEAATDVREREVDEGDEPVKPYELIARDQERFSELQSKDEAERGDEFTELAEHIAAYDAEVEARLEEIVKPKRTALSNLDMSQLVSQVRNLRIEAASNQEFLHVYAAQSWLHGALRHPGGNRVWKTVTEMHEAPPEAITAVAQAFQDLQNSEGGSQGNS